MAISVLRKIFNDPHYDYYVVDDDGVYVEFICDSSSDISNLPTAYSDTFKIKPRPGSTALDCDASEVYVLSPARTWGKLEVG